MSKLLIDDYPLIVLPKLAKAIGLNDSIFLQQLHYWLSNKKVGTVADGQKWVKNSVREWQEDNFPFWHTNTIIKIVARLQERELILTRDDLNQRRDDKTLWYSIDYEKLDKLTEPITQRGKGQSHNVVKAYTTTCETPIPQRGKSYIEQRLTETKEETTREDSASGDSVTVADAYNVYQNEIGSLTAISSEQIGDLCDEYTAAWFVDAVKVAVKANTRRLTYIEGILKRWHRDGKSTGSKAQAAAKTEADQMATFFNMASGG